MQAALAARLPAEVLHRVREIGLLASDARELERVVEHAARGADEGVALDVLVVARLLADEHEMRAARPLAEDGLRRLPPEIAALAAGRRRAHLVEIARLGHETLCTGMGGHDCSTDPSCPLRRAPNPPRERHERAAAPMARPHCVTGPGTG